MKYSVNVIISNDKIIVLELDDVNSPKTVLEFIEKLSFSIDLNVWGDEIYTSESPISSPEKNAKTPVRLNDVAYWPTGKAICLFFGPTPIGNLGEITPASPVNILGKIISPDKTILNNADGNRATFSLEL